MISVIIAAAGSGTRMNTKEKKQFIELGGLTILERTLKQFDLEDIHEFVLVINKEDEDRVNEMISSLNMDKAIGLVYGGKRRQDSIYEGLLKASGDIIMVHDGARPFVSKSIIMENIYAVQKDVGVVTAVPCKDTIKIVKEHEVESTLDRSALYQIQTPQTFYRDQLLKAYDYAYEKALEVTDDASVVEAFGGKVKVVKGSYNNIKITTQEDLLYGEFILERVLCE